MLFVAIDDLNDWIGALGGYSGVKTPHLDRLAQRGVLFTRAYCSAPACNPSRASLMCGLRPATTGVYHNDQPWRPVLSKAVTLPQHFMAHGYHVIGGGKIYHDSYNDLASWHKYFTRPGFPEPAKTPANGLDRGHFDWGPVDADDDAMGDGVTVDWAIQYLHEKHDKPFFLAVGLTRPHLPWYVPKKYFDQYPLSEIKLPRVLPDDLDDVPPAGRKMANPQGDHKAVVEAKQWEEAVQAYLASITYADATVGRLFTALRKSDYADNTIVVAWGDHGWHLGEKQHWRKFALWEEATRVPLMMVVPGLARPEGKCERTVTLLDIYPTLIELCRLPPKRELEGLSLVPLLKDPSAAWDRPAVTTHGRNNHAVRSERFRYIRYQDGSEELYDHHSDPLEWTNLAEKAEFAAIKHKLAGFLPEVNVEDAPREKGSGAGGQGPGKNGKR